MDYLEWFASITAMIAAAAIAADISRRVTGWAFVLFCVSAAAWITYGARQGEQGLWVLNAVLLGINALGVYRYLIRKSPRA